MASVFNFSSEVSRALPRLNTPSFIELKRGCTRNTIISTLTHNQTPCEERKVFNFCVRSICLACAICSLRAADVIASGTGFAVSPAGHILTNAHVVSGCTKVTAKIGGAELSAEVVSVDTQNDLALLKISGTFTAVLPLREGTRVQLGETVIAFGYPLQGLISTSLNMTTGNISSLAGLGDDARSLQFTAPIQPGNSGGPLAGC
jgi:S1-C subfamily serine protease